MTNAPAPLALTLPRPADPDAAPGSVRVAVPGKVMLAGEYSVLAGGRALAATLARHLTVTVTAHPAAGAEVRSELWDGPRTVHGAVAAAGPLGSAAVEEPLLRAVAYGLARHGVDKVAVRVTSELDQRFGIGSSSALRLGVQVGLGAWAAGTAPRPAAALWADARAAFDLQQQAQRHASGYDVATQLVGGLVLYTPPAAGDAWPGTALAQDDALAAALPELVQVWVGGAGAPTGPVTRDTRAWLDRTAAWPRLGAATDALLAALLAALAAPRAPARLAALAHAVRVHRSVLAASPHAPAALTAALAALPGEGERWSVKTTGAGGEDALLVFVPAAAGEAGAAAVLRARGWEPLATPFETTAARGTRVGLGREASRDG